MNFLLVLAVTLSVLSINTNSITTSTLFLQIESNENKEEPAISSNNESNNEHDTNLPHSTGIKVYLFTEKSHEKETGFLQSVLKSLSFATDMLE